MNYINKNDLKINSTLFEFINQEAIPGLDIKSEDFWKNFGKVVHELAPINKSLIKKRETIQKKIDDWHKKDENKDFNKEKYINFLKSISYIVEKKEDFKINTSDVDKEISSIAGPQLVVPVDNARYALNAANARWGSLYDALYGTDVIPGEKGKGHNKERANTHLYSDYHYSGNFVSVNIRMLKKEFITTVCSIIIIWTDSSYEFFF